MWTAVVKVSDAWCAPTQFRPRAAAGDAELAGGFNCCVSTGASVFGKPKVVVGAKVQVLILLPCKVERPVVVVRGSLDQGHMRARDSGDRSIPAVSDAHVQIACVKCFKVAVERWKVLSSISGRTASSGAPHAPCHRLITTQLWDIVLRYVESIACHECF